jgi:monoterpene epsilon-lactone hydrolase
MNGRNGIPRALGGILNLTLMTALPAVGFALSPSTPDDDGTVHVPAFELPESGILSDKSRSELKKERTSDQEEAKAPPVCPSDHDAQASQMPAIRRCYAAIFYKSPYYRELRARYAVNIDSSRLGGVDVETILPADGVTPRNKKRILINLHGGGFLGGSRTLSQIESIPIASVGKIRVVSIDYRMGPEYAFPAASQDVAAVYRELLKTYAPTNIGIYGCSAGGLLTAQAVAWISKEGLPRPGAMGMLCEGALYWSVGDSGRIGAAIAGEDLESPEETRYLKGANFNDPLVFPARSPEVMAKFPPSLLVSSTRDKALSSVAITHSELVAQGVAAELHVWEGLGHAFFYNFELPESREVYSVIVKFFDTHLGT